MTNCVINRQDHKPRSAKYLSARLRNTCVDKGWVKSCKYKLVGASATPRDGLRTCDTLSVPSTTSLTRATRNHFVSRLERAQQRGQLYCWPPRGRDDTRADKRQRSLRCNFWCPIKSLSSQSHRFCSLPQYTSAYNCCLDTEGQSLLPIVPDAEVYQGP